MLLFLLQYVLVQGMDLHQCWGDTALRVRALGSEVETVDTFLLCEQLPSQNAHMRILSVQHISLIFPTTGNSSKFVPVYE